jgi:hypothetical protein
VIISITTYKLRGQDMKPVKCPQVIDNTVVNYAMNHPEPGMSCKTCRYYCLEVLLDEDEHQPIETRVDYTADELIDLNDTLITRGFCTRQLDGSPSILLINVWSDHGCEYYEERTREELFVDDGTEEGELVLPTVHY